MAKVTIKSEGIGAIYKKDDVWKILYPFGNDHCVKIRYRKEGEANFNDLGMFGKPDMKLEFKTTKQTQNAKEGNDFNTLFDMTGQDAHKVGVRLKQDWKQHAVLFEIHNAVINVTEKTNSRYVLHREGSEDKNLENIGYSITAQVDLEAGELFSFVANNNVLFQAEEGKDYEIFVNNDCHDDNKRDMESRLLAFLAELSNADKFSDIFKIMENELEIRNTTDFTMLYNFLEDSIAPDFRLSVVRHKDDLPKLPTVFKLVPESTNPFAGDDGKPCHKVKIGNISNLP